MNYDKIYESLIYRARTRTPIGYIERHHVIPRCMGGDNKKSNIVQLYPEEHYLAHQLLVKIYPNNSKLIYAANMMIACSSNQTRNNKLYGWLRRKLSEEAKKRTGPKNGSFGTMWIHNGMDNRKIKILNEIPDGWMIGRRFKTNTYKDRQTRHHLAINKKRNTRIAQIQTIRQDAPQSVTRYVRGATDIQIAESLSKFDNDIILAMAHLGYNNFGGYSYMRFKGIASHIVKNV